MQLYKRDEKYNIPPQFFRNRVKNGSECAKVTKTGTYQHGCRGNCAGMCQFFFLNGSSKAYKHGCATTMDSTTIKGIEDTNAVVQPR